MLTFWLTLFKSSEIGIGTGVGWSIADSTSIQTHLKHQFSIKLGACPINGSCMEYAKQCAGRHADLPVRRVVFLPQCPVIQGFNLGYGKDVSLTFHHVTQKYRGRENVVRRWREKGCGA